MVWGNNNNKMLHQLPGFKAPKRRRRNKAHPPLNEILKQMNNDDEEEDSEDEDFDGESMVIPHGHLVLELQPKYRTGLMF